MENLALSEDASHEQILKNDEKVKRELEQAGIETFSHEIFRKSNEPKTSVVGTLCDWSFKRAWYYFVAEGSGIPPDKAEEFHKTWGKEVRVNGNCTCPSPLKANKGFAVDLYHIDSQAGLNAFAKLLKEIYVEY